MKHRDVERYNRKDKEMYEDKTRVKGPISVHDVSL